jgi:multicomponent Na+:H+ antiporter subunit G
MTYQEIAILILASIGVLFSFISAIGIVRLPDVYARMHALGKALTLGVMCILLSAGIVFPDQLVILVILIILFFVTGPIATTTMARAAYRTDPYRDFVLNYDDLAQFETTKANASKVENEQNPADSPPQKEAPSQA